MAATPLARGERQPQVSLIGSVENFELNEISPNHDDMTTTIGVTAEWDVFTGGAKVAAIDAAIDITRGAHMGWQISPEILLWLLPLVEWLDFRSSR